MRNTLKCIFQVLAVFVDKVTTTTGYEIQGLFHDLVDIFK